MLNMPVPENTRAPVIDATRDYGRYVRAVIERPALGPGAEVLTGVEVSFEEQLVQLSACEYLYMY